MPGSPEAFTARTDFPEIYDAKKGMHVPSADAAIDKIKGALINNRRMNAKDARKKARQLVFDFQSGKITAQELESFYR